MENEMSKQVKIYSVDTKAFYTSSSKDEKGNDAIGENEINNQMSLVQKDIKICDEYLKYSYLNNIDKLEGFKVSKESIEDYITNAKRYKHLKYLIGALSLEEIEEIKQDDEYFHTIRKLIKSDKPRSNRNKDKDKQEGKVYYRLKDSKYTQFKNKNEARKELNSKKNEHKKQLEDLIYKNKQGDITRELNKSALTEYNQISIFDSALTRTLEIETNNLSMDIIVVRVYHYDIMYSLIYKGFTYNNENYIFFVASAGQIRDKKLLMMKESIYKDLEKTFMCGLTKEDINNMGGINTNKFLSYLALNSSGTDEIITSIEEIFEDEIEINEEEQVTVTQEIKGFNIDRCIVIEDFETEVTGIVDYIEKKEVDKEFKIKYRDAEGKKKTKKETRTVLELQDNITRQEMKVPIMHSDGCGWLLKGKVNHMIRLPWIKGLMAVNSKCLAWCDEYNNGSYKIIDIDGREHDLKVENIEYVFTRSQFKLWKFYQNTIDEKGHVVEYGWDKYKKAFKDNNCKANMCNIEPTRKTDYRKAKFNYQMWQTLTDITDAEIQQFTEPAKEYLKNIYTDKDTMLKELKADKDNKKKNYFQQALSIYPELLKDAHCKSELANKILRKKKEYKAGKFVMDAHYSYIIPELFSWMTYSIKGYKNPVGLLEDGEVSCKLFKANELIVERSPHLYKEHSCQTNINNELTDKWLKSNAIYVSCNSLLSKLLMFDCDGDKALIVNEPNKLLPIVKRNIGYDLPHKDSEGKWNMDKVVPLYYVMGKAAGQDLNEDNFYNSLVSAFTSSNIGKFSNQLTKLWDKTTEGDDLTTHKILTALNNYQIDSAKTLQPAYASTTILEKINELEKGKLPYFFQFAKDKEEYQTNEIGTGTIDRIVKEIESLGNNPKFDFSKVGRFSHKTLMNNSKIKINDNIIQAYKNLNEEKDMWFMKSDMDKNEISSAIYDNIKYEFSLVCEENNVEYEDGVDMVVKYIYIEEKSFRKTILFTVFGEEIVNNLNKNINKPLEDGNMLCKRCGDRFEKASNNQKYCDKCKEEMDKTEVKKCECCGKEIINPTSNKQKYCSECKKEMKKKNDRERLAKKRAIAS